MIASFYFITVNQKTTMPLENPSQVYTIVDTWALEFAIKEANMTSVIMSLAYHHILVFRAVLRKALKKEYSQCAAF